MRETLRLVDELRQREAQHVGLDHNQRSETLQIPPADDVAEEAAVATDALLAELTTDRPHLSSIRLAMRALRRVTTWIADAAAWVGRKADSFIDEYLKHLAKPAAHVTALVIGAKLIGIRTTLDAVHSLMVGLLGLVNVGL